MKIKKLEQMTDDECSVREVLQAVQVLNETIASCKRQGIEVCVSMFSPFGELSEKEQVGDPGPFYLTAARRMGPEIDICDIE